MGDTALGGVGRAALLAVGLLAAVSAYGEMRDQPVRVGFRQIHIGDTMGKVRDAAGAPDATVRKHGQLYWIYEQSGRMPRTSMIEFTDGVVSSTRMY